MASVTATEAKTHFRKLLQRVRKGEEIIITRHEKAVARLVPEGHARNRDIRNAVAGLRLLQAEIKERTSGRKSLSASEIKSAIEEGRR
jgi:prevent-host-death family protein